jgi:hypothetical protein
MSCFSECKEKYSDTWLLQRCFYFCRTPSAGFSGFGRFMNFYDMSKQLQRRIIPLRQFGFGVAAGMDTTDSVYRYRDRVLFDKDSLACMMPNAPSGCGPQYVGPQCIPPSNTGKCLIPIGDAVPYNPPPVVKRTPPDKTPLVHGPRNGTTRPSRSSRDIPAMQQDSGSGMGSLFELALLGGAGYLGYKAYKHYKGKKG